MIGALRTLSETGVSALALAVAVLAALLGVVLTGLALGQAAKARRLRDMARSIVSAQEIYIQTIDEEHMEARIFLRAKPGESLTEAAERALGERSGKLSRELS
jgi:hypothetical protein